MTDKATSLVAQSKKWASSYGAYPNGAEGTVLTIPLRAGAAWNDNDATAFAQLFTADGSDLIGDRQLHGPDDIADYLTQAFAGAYKGSTLKQTPIEVKLLTHDVAIAITEGGFIPVGESDDSSPNEHRAVWVIVKQVGDWKLFSHQTSPR